MERLLPQQPRRALPQSWLASCSGLGGWKTCWDPLVQMQTRLRREVAVQLMREAMARLPNRNRAAATKVGFQEGGLDGVGRHLRPQTLYRPTGLMLGKATIPPLEVRPCCCTGYLTSNPMPTLVAEGGEAQLSKKKLRAASRLKVAELKQACARPDVVEIWDVTAADPKLLVHLKVCARDWHACCPLGQSVRRCV